MLRRLSSRRRDAPSVRLNDVCVTAAAPGGSPGDGDGGGGGAQVSRDWSPLDLNTFQMFATPAPKTLSMSSSLNW